MNEEEVKSRVERFFEKHGFKVEREAPVHGYRVDLLAEGGGKKFFVECRGDRRLRSHEIHVMIGQIVSEMYEVGSDIHYCLAMPFSLATYLIGFGTEGIKALNLHLIVVLDRGLWEGDVCYLDKEGTGNFIQELKIGDSEVWYLKILNLRGYPN